MSSHSPNLCCCHSFLVVDSPFLLCPNYKRGTGVRGWEVLSPERVAASITSKGGEGVPFTFKNEELVWEASSQLLWLGFGLGSELFKVGKF